MIDSMSASLRAAFASTPPQLRRRAFVLLGTAAFLMVAISIYKYYSYSHEKTLREAELAAGPKVRLSKVKRGPGQHIVTVIGETRPYQNATLYAKVSGYLSKILVENGDKVKSGQNLAVIQSPETDQAFIAADADAKNKKAILERTRSLFKKQLVSQQEFDQAQADAEVSSARHKSQETIKGYEVLRAPFAGTITARYADPGALVQNAMNSETSALPVVMISDIDRLRIDIFIDQRDATYVRENDPVTITMSERPGFKILGKVARVSGQLDPRTKMLLTEIDIPNADQAIVAGSFVQVSLTVKSASYLEAPVEALAMKDNKTYLTVIQPDNTLALKEISIVQNDGKSISFMSGADEGSRVALNLGTVLAEGSKVRPIEEPTAAPNPAPVPASPASGAPTTAAAEEKK